MMKKGKELIVREIAYELTKTHFETPKQARGERVSDIFSRLLKERIIMLNGEVSIYLRVL